MTVLAVLECIDEKGGKERNMSCFLNTWDTASVHKHTAYLEHCNSQSTKGKKATQVGAVLPKKNLRYLSDKCMVCQR